MFDLKNIQDWELFKQGKFKPVSLKFDLLEALKEVELMVEVRCKTKGLKLEFD